MMIRVVLQDAQSGEPLGFFHTSTDALPEDMANMIRAELEQIGLTGFDPERWPA